MTRPALTRDLAVDTFVDSYWLKEELLAFCRRERLSSGGSKRELEARIAAFLGGAPVAPRAPKRRPAVMPDAFEPVTVVGEGWRCSQALRAYFEIRTGKPFKFDARMRDMIANGAGQTLADILVRWQSGASSDRKPIDEQFEYNRFTRAYRDAHPAASRAQLIAAWYLHRDTPKSKRSA